MKAAIINTYGSPDVFGIKDVPMPVPKPYQVLIKVHATSINPIDYKTRKGNLKYILGSHFPIILGYDVAGEIVETGDKTRGFKPGDRVFTRLTNKYGQALAEYAVADEQILAPIPEGLSYQEAAAFPLACLTALQALRNKARIKKGQQVCIIGATGGVGHFAVQIAKWYGAHVTAYCGPGHKNMLNLLQPDEVIRYSDTSISRINRTFDIVLDTAGKSSFITCRRILNRHGTYISVLPRPKLLAHKFIALFTSKKVKTLIMKTNKRDMEWLSDQISKGVLKVNIDRIFSLEQIAQAHEYAEKGHTEGKIVVTL